MKRSQYLRLRKQLLGTIQQPIPVSFRRLPLKLPDNYGVRGHYNFLDPKISIQIYGKPSYAQILLVLAHEIRHRQQHEQGLFSAYYDPRYQYSEQTIKQLVNQELPLPDLDIGYQAENDCNAFAREFLAQAGVVIDYTRPSYKDFLHYPKEATGFAFLLQKYNLALQTRKQQKTNILELTV